MNASFYTAITGSKSLQYAMDTWSDNIANIDTVGFRANDVGFADLLSKSITGTASGTTDTASGGVGTYNQVGYGTSVNSTSMITSQGTVTKTGVTFDMAIQGKGWFEISLANGQLGYTRSGEFNPDANGNLVSTGGNKVYGMSSPYMSIASDGTGTITNTAMPSGLLNQTSKPIVLPNIMTYPATPAVPPTISVQNPQKVSIIQKPNQEQLNTMLTAGSSTNIVFGSTKSESGKLVITDSSGNAVKTVNMTTAQMNSGTYSWDGLTDSGAQAPTGLYTSTLSFPSANERTIGYSLPFATVATVYVKDSSGNLVNTIYPEMQQAGQNTVAWNGKDSNGNAVPSGDYFASVSYVSKPGVAAINQGNLIGYNVNSQGQIVAGFDNGMSTVVAQVPIYHFQNDQGLENIGNNTFAQSANSGNPFQAKNTSGQNIQGSTIVPESLEMSNVSLSTAMTNLIVIQRSFDANAKCIKTSDELIQRAINLKKG